MTQPDSAAPHGRDANGTPLAPYGLNMDGSPRKSNRGARAGQGQRKGTGRMPGQKPSSPKMVGSSLSDDDRKGMLTELADMFLVTPLASASQIPFLQNRIGKAQTDALAGDAFILAQFMPSIADGLILWSKTKPATLAWLDKAEQSAPMLVLANALIQAGKAIGENHFNPNPRVAMAGRSLAAMRVAQMAEAVNAQAAAMTGEPIPEPEQFEAAAYERAMRESDPTVQFATA